MLHNIRSVRPSMAPQHSESRIQDRPKRRKAGDDAFTCSQQSILSAMDRFVNSVSSMDSTVLIPSRLRDMETEGDNIKKRPPPFISKSDLFSLYLSLHDINNELLWGPSTCVSTSSSSGSETGAIKHTLPSSKGSTELRSGNSVSDSDSQGDSDLDNITNDPELTKRDAETKHLANAYRYHLQGLYTILHQLADFADYLSSRYQEEVDAPTL
ncbi:mid1-interacting protein 1-B-like [Limulus polyphemus]|uniref:Mid1-interacting protein 1-B-like n=1 Tax=Limulus polyphemus TaxID=6850 RepID=A0ABM1BZ29_LIMPO|nr:mid1-interacting protein 1-B-like [Limulus polyphemus]